MDRASTQSDRSAVNADPDLTWIRSDASTSTSARKGIHVVVGQGNQFYDAVAVLVADRT